MSIPSKLKVPKNVFVLGLVSLFNDIASEMIYPIIPIFLTAVLQAPVITVGFIEGMAEAVSSFLKVVSGWLSDKFKKRKPFVVGGYSLSTLSKVLIGLAYHWPLVFVARIGDRLGKGVRTSARDALIADSTLLEQRGRAFGLHRTMDTMGAVFGPLLALLFLALVGEPHLRYIFFLAFIPAFIGVVLLVLFVKDRPVETVAGPKLSFKFSSLSPKFKLFLLISLIFCLGNSADAFLILRAKDLGFSTSLAVLAYVTFNITYALFSMPAGILADKIGFRKVFLAGMLIFAVVYSGFGLTHSGALLWILFPIYGFYMAFTEGVGKAYISKLVAKEHVATAMGFYQMATGLCLLAASLIGGALWTYINPSLTFIFGGVMATIAAIVFVVLGHRLPVPVPVPPKIESQS
ncbi:MAG: hypothetical protein A2445_00520 [Candidatus Jacksonbacteria bacterium RIFOXYC2_FULL_44_29]|nr:MAG: Major facilitator superfamily [Parcubacteria group bacterium GW2011_GWC2_44_22]OGY75783.1 MAG: hypothetical protein A2295_03295 [Candidatus Jacksonbacteria bacterium RIFOXYB2_FULL_44_15]OGY76345.1 MAG: hypothetical protein A2240_04255 [Candidatus Jacksonbacteria bacterium RIFOXYA2_FULL_43_12]OGY77982.1 MAG: hypothetical protein A2445_00520 [Candidatus Jacksonbacteria bacterium RIFOXYC2_FULL_44_29]OGY81556.1 MAG: hypothetical protein A2550_00975 [Candidatus Jacksonbacteria bacterium RIFO